MSGTSYKLKSFQNDAAFVKDYIESLASGDSVEQEFPDMVMLLGFLRMQPIQVGAFKKDDFHNATYKDFRKMVALIAWEEQKYSQDMFQDYAVQNIDEALNTPLMRAAYRVSCSLYPDPHAVDWRAWQIFHLVSGRPLYAGANIDMSEIYFQLGTPNIKPKQLLGKKIFDGILKMGMTTKFDIILMMLVCWTVEKKKKLEEPSILKRKGISITSGNVESISYAVKAFLDGWTHVASRIFHLVSLEDLFTPFILYNVKKMEFSVLEEGLYAIKRHKWSVFLESSAVQEPQCDYEDVLKRSSEQNERIRKLTEAFFKSFWDAIESLRTSEVTGEAFRKEHGPRETPCPKKGYIPVSIWKLLEDLSIVQRDIFTGPPAGMPTFCILPKHIIRHFVVCFQCWDLEEGLGNLSLDEWPETLQDKFNQIPPFSLLSVDETEFNVRVGPSSIPNSGLGVFAKDNLKKGTVVGWYNGAIVYRDFELDMSADAVYGSDRFGCSVDRFKKYALEVNGSGTFLVAPEFCIAGKVNDPRCLDNGKNSPNAEPNCIFDSKACAINGETVKNPFLVTLKTCKYVNAGHELFVDYGEKYSNWT